MNVPRVYRTEAVVLRRHDVGEADRILTLYTPRFGKVRAIAKGARRPKSRLGGHVELFAHVQLQLAQGRNLDVVTQAEALHHFRYLRDDLWKTAGACYAAELVDRFTEERLENQPLFDLLVQLLTVLDGLDGPLGSASGAGRERDEQGESAGPPAAMELALRNFEVQLLGALGYAPELLHCVQCGARLVPGDNRFSATAGGVLCEACSRGHPGAQRISVNAIKVLRLMAQEPFGIFRRLRLEPEAAREVERALRAQINHLLERQPRAAEFLDRLRAGSRRSAGLAAAVTNG